MVCDVQVLSPTLQDASLASIVGFGEARRLREDTGAPANSLEARVRELMAQVDARTGQRHVLGSSDAWRTVLSQTARVASTATTVLLLGESGTGKEVVARFLHRASPRAQGPFVAINCAALPEHLLEAELFGYERGAFTGAAQSKPGQLEQASGGTLFLDEIGEMTPTAQAKLLRVLQEREFQRLGGTRVLRSHARIVAATNRDLEQAVAAGQFREDLFYRLSVFPIRLPALRDRREDILVLAKGFLDAICNELGRPPAGISRDARQQLLDYHWPGNARELRNALERAAILCDGGLITSDHLSVGTTVAASADREEDDVAGPGVSNRSPFTDTTLASLEHAAIEKALVNARFNKSRAAKVLGLTRHQLYIRMRRYGIQ